VPTARAVPRGTVAPPRTRAYAEPRVYGYARPRHAVPIVVYPRPYFSFRPHFWLGYGLSVGYPIGYPVTFGYPSYVYGYPESGVAPAPVEGSYGGVTFDITPPDASVSVDGAYVGSVSDFSPTHQPLTLTPGRHHIELQAAGAIPVAFDVDILPGQVIPYQGALQPD